MKRLWRALTIFYTPSFPVIITYMLQSTEYQVKPYLAWFWRTQNFANVMRRRQLERTKAARLLLLALRLGMLLEIALGLWLLYLWHWRGVAGGLEFGLALLIAYPVIWAHLVVLPLLLGRILIINPNERRLIRESERIFKKHKGAKIAVAGSYGKTSMKELLVTILSTAKQVVATPGNKNVPISHAYFARRLTGNEDILVIEYGEGAPGDVARFARTTHPTHGVITGLAPAHLNQYKTLEAAGEDIFSLASYLKNKNVYVNGDSPSLAPFIKKEFITYNHAETNGWKVSKVKVHIDGLDFTLKKRKRILKLHSGLLGRHQLGPLSLVVALAADMGLKEDDIKAGVAQTAPYEHRMQPYKLSGGWVIDDTYNGNIEGVRAGTELLRELSAKRKIYVTPGLVDQGVETKPVHNTMGELIAAAKPDLVVLMKNSVTDFIKEGLHTGGYEGELQIETDPLAFYTNLGEFLATGDLALLQNDWTDNYV